MGLPRSAPCSAAQNFQTWSQRWRPYTWRKPICREYPGLVVGAEGEVARSGHCLCHRDSPTGPRDTAADIERALGVLSWQPLRQGGLNPGFVSDSVCYLTAASPTSPAPHGSGWCWTASSSLDNSSVSQCASASQKVEDGRLV